MSRDGGWIFAIEACGLGRVGGCTFWLFCHPVNPVSVETLWWQTPWCREVDLIQNFGRLNIDISGGCWRCSFRHSVVIVQPILRYSTYGYRQGLHFTSSEFLKIWPPHRQRKMLYPMWQDIKKYQRRGLFLSMETKRSHDARYWNASQMQTSDCQRIITEDTVLQHVLLKCDLIIAKADGWGPIFRVRV